MNGNELHQLARFFLEHFLVVFTFFSFSCRVRALARRRLSRPSETFYFFIVLLTRYSANIGNQQQLSPVDLMRSANNKRAPDEQLLTLRLKRILFGSSHLWR